MLDHHIHIGQFNEIYYDALEIFEIIEKVGSQFGINEIHYSSTSSCRDDVELKKIEEEIAYAQSFESDILKVRPYLWFVPKYAEEGISVKSAMESFDYCGIKLHPFGQEWDFENPIHRKCLEEIFAWCDEKNSCNEKIDFSTIARNDTDFDEKAILIHCGTDKCDRPNRFEEFIKAFPNAKTILAHSNPVDETIEMISKYQNAFCDVAVTPKKDVEKLIQSKKEKILFGSDFPITNYFGQRLFNQNLTLEEQYKKDCEIKTLF